MPKGSGIDRNSATSTGGFTVRHQPIPGDQTTFERDKRGNVINVGRGSTNQPHKAILNNNSSTTEDEIPL